MFTAVELDWLKAFLETYIINGDYTDYVAWTIDNTSDYATDQYDFYVLISKGTITKSGTTWRTDSDYVLLKVDSSGASRNYFHARYVTSSGNSTSVTIQEYNHVYTNVVDFYADILAYEDYQNTHNISLNLDLNNIYIFYVLLGVMILQAVFKSSFPNRIGD